MLASFTHISSTKMGSPYAAFTELDSYGQWQLLNWAIELVGKRTVQSARCKPLAAWGWHC